MRILLSALALVALAASPYAQDWGALATVSTTMGVQGGKICLGEASRGDIGCPTYAPSVANNGNISTTGSIAAQVPNKTTHAMLLSDGSLQLYRGTSATTPSVNGYVDFSADPTFGRYGRMYYYDANGQFLFQNTSGTADVVVQRNLNVSGTIYGNGSGLTNLPSSSTDRITSGTTFVRANTGGTVEISGTTFLNSYGVGDARLALGAGASGNRYAYIDLIGDTTYSSYGLRILRNNTGPNADSWIQNRGTGGLIIDNLEAAPIQFRTSDVERMRIASNGNVGIGTTTPGAKLDISATGLYSNIEFSGHPFQIDTGGSSNDYAMFMGADKTNGLSYIQSVHVNTAKSPLALNPQGGNVGIATTNPAYLLDVAGTIRSSGEIISTNANQFRMVQGNYGAFWRNDGSNLYLLLTNSGDQYGNWNSLRPIVVDLASGKMGMGGAPVASAQLSVYGTVSATSFVGNGSGLTNITAATASNANTLNNLTSGQFVRSDADTSMTPGVGIRFGHANQSDANDGFISAGRFASGLNIVGTQTVANEGRVVRVWGNLIDNNANKYWNAANDGSGSGLDADLLDGQDSSAFLTKANVVSGNACIGNGTTVDCSNSNVGTKDDITTRTPSGFWQTSNATTATGWPVTSNSWYHLLTATHSNTSNYFSMQFAGDFFNSNNLYYRATNNSGTATWNKVWHSGNQGSGSGLDADMLDGVHGASFLRRETNTWQSASDGLARFYYSNNGRTYLLGPNASDYILTLRASDNNDKVHFSQDGNMWLAAIGDWISNRLVPSHAVMAFNLTSCPSGWSEYTPARGRFLRGIDNGAGNDPDGTRAPGAVQADMFKSHTHNTVFQNDGRTLEVGTTSGDDVQFSFSDAGGTHGPALITTATGGAETRPKNVALLYCEKN